MLKFQYVAIRYRLIGLWGVIAFDYLSSMLCTTALQHRLIHTRLICHAARREFDQIQLARGIYDYCGVVINWQSYPLRVGEDNSNTKLRKIQMHQQGQTKGWCKVFGLAQSKGFCPYLSKFMTAFLSVFCKIPSFWVRHSDFPEQLAYRWKMKTVVKKKKSLQSVKSHLSHVSRNCLSFLNFKDAEHKNCSVNLC